MSSISGGLAEPKGALSTDDAWFDALYRANYSPVVRLCDRILRNPDDAADAAQEVFLAAIGALRPEAKPAQARNWLLTVARNHCIDLLRRRKRMGHALVTLNAGSAELDFESAVANRDFVDIVLSKLPARERRALWESAVECRPLADIAGRLKLSYMAAAQVVHRARQHALAMASRVAVVLGGFQISRLLRRLWESPKRLVSSLGPSSADQSLLAAHRLLALAALPLIMIASQSSSSSAPHPGSSVRPTHSALTAPLTRPPSGVRTASGTVAGSGGSIPDPLATGLAGSIEPPTVTVPGLPTVTPSLPAVPLPVQLTVPSVLPSIAPSPLP